VLLYAVHTLQVRELQTAGEVVAMVRDAPVIDAILQVYALCHATTRHSALLLHAVGL
jgi:hypothetical protein